MKSEVVEVSEKKNLSEAHDSKLFLTFYPTKFECSLIVKNGGRSRIPKFVKYNTESIKLIKSQ